MLQGLFIDSANIWLKTKIDVNPRTQVIVPNGLMN